MSVEQQIKQEVREVHAALDEAKEATSRKLYHMAEKLCRIAQSHLDTLKLLRSKKGEE